jgi:CubicO group peptidase (beta-lactamase class C family)
MRGFRFLTWMVLLSIAVRATPARAQESLPAAMQAAIDSIVTGELASSGAPSASIAVVREGRLAYLHAYGVAEQASARPATVDMRYSIGSISKQFTASAILLLAEAKRLSLDDPVARWLPELTRAREVTVRQVLSMTSGYQDYWPQDYVMPPMLLPVSPRKICDEWAAKPLDFEPGSRWQYSNTNYVIAGLIVEKASGMPLLDFLQRRIFTPLGMPSIANIDAASLGPEDAAGYRRFALGPPRPAPKEGPGWLFAAGELAMTARDLARWDVSMIDQKVLSPASYRLQQTEILLTSGVGTHYGLGVSVNSIGGRRRISHSGEVSGYTANNLVYPDDRTAIVVLTNLDATNASGAIAQRIAQRLFSAADSATDQAVAQARAIFAGLQQGHIVRALFSPNANAYFTTEAVADFAASLGPLGPATAVVSLGQELRGGMTGRWFEIRCGDRTLRLTTFTLPDGTLEQYQISS